MEWINKGNSSMDVALRWLTSLLVVLFPTATLFVNRGDSYTLGLLSLIGILVWLRYRARSFLNRYSTMLWIVFVLFFAVAVLSYVIGYQTEDGFHYLGRDLRFLFIAPVYLAFRRYSPTAKTVFIGLALGALISGVLALLQFLHAHVPIRVAATTDLSIIFGDLSTTMVLCTVAGFGLLAAPRRGWTLILLILSIAGGVAATLLSGTRGAWISLLLLLLALPTRFGGFLRGRYVVLITAVVLAAFCLSYLVPRTATQSRLGLINVQVRDYFRSLGTFAPLADPSTVHPRCINGEAFLGAWVAAGRTAGGANVDIRVVEDNSLSHGKQPNIQCPADYAIRIRNLGDAKAVEFILPRVVVPETGVQQTQLLVRGTGVVSFTGDNNAYTRINAAAYAPALMIGSHEFGKAISVFVGPGRTIWLVPLDSYFGEYSFAPANNNVGQRFEMWRAAWHLFLNHPVLGVGTGAYQMQTRELIRRRDIAPIVIGYDHPHNDYLDALSSRGIIGFLALLALLLIPTWRFLRATRSPCRITHALGMGGLLTVAGFAIYALTDTIFLHSMMITWYVIYMALFYALLDSQASKQAQQRLPNP